MNNDSKITKVEVVDKDNNVLISMNYNKVEYDKKFDKNYFELNSIIKLNEDTNKNETNITNNKEITSQNNNSNNTVEQSNNQNTTTTPENNNETSQDKKTTPTATIEDVIYPMYLPENTYLTSQEKVSTNNGERLILTFSGDNAFTLVEETISNNDSNIVIPVSGEFDFLSDVIGIIGNNSIMWHSNGIEYYITSNTIETSVLADIARSISILPVSK